MVNWLAARFHQVVHQVLAAEAGGARLQRISGGPYDHARKCSADALRLRADRTAVDSGQSRRLSVKPQESARGRFASGLSVIAERDWQGCKIAPPGRIGCGGQRLRRSSRRSNGYAASAGRACTGRRLASHCQLCSAPARLE
jgi:hypothetical protein